MEAWLRYENYGETVMDMSTLMEWFPWYGIKVSVCWFLWCAWPGNFLQVYYFRITNVLDSLWLNTFLDGLVRRIRLVNDYDKGDSCVKHVQRLVSILKYHSCVVIWCIILGESISLWRFRNRFPDFLEMKDHWLFVLCRSISEVPWSKFAFVFICFLQLYLRVILYNTVWSLFIVVLAAGLSYKVLSYIGFAGNFCRRCKGLSILELFYGQAVSWYGGVFGLQGKEDIIVDPVVFQGFVGIIVQVEIGVYMPCNRYQRVWLIDKVPVIKMSLDAGRFV